MASGLLALAVVLFLQTFKVRNFPGSRFGAEIWPRAIIICLGVLAALLLVQSLRRASQSETGKSLREIIARESIAFMVFACFFCFLWLVPRLGAYPAGGVFVFAVLSLLGLRNPRAVLNHLLLAIGVTVVLWGLFTHILKIIPPVGRWWSLI